MAAYSIVVKNGKRYHYYPNRPPGQRYVLVQPRATMSTGKGRAAGTPSFQAGQGYAAGTPKPGSAPAAPPPAAASPVPLIDPFLRPEDLQALADFNFSEGNQLADIDRNLADLRTQTGYDRQQVDRQAKQGTSDATDSAIARGLFRSSIKDATLYDIEGQRVRQQQLYTDRLGNAAMDADRRKSILRQARAELDKRLADQAVANAREASANQPVASPQPAAPAAPAANPKFKSLPGNDSAGRPGVWHIYPDGRRVFVRR
jgi:hypothetical protein